MPRGAPGPPDARAVVIGPDRSGRPPGAPAISLPAKPTPNHLVRVAWPVAIQLQTPPPFRLALPLSLSTSLSFTLHHTYNQKQPDRAERPSGGSPPAFSKTASAVPSIAARRPAPQPSTPPTSPGPNHARRKRSPSARLTHFPVVSATLPPSRQRLPRGRPDPFLYSLGEDTLHPLAGGPSSSPRPQRSGRDPSPPKPSLALLQLMASISPRFQLGSHIPICCYPLSPYKKPKPSQGPTARADHHLYRSVLGFGQFYPRTEEALFN